MIRKTIRQNSSVERRSGAAAVEMAMVLPILILFFFAQVELVRLNNIRNSVYLSAYEGAREGLIPGATTTDIENRVNMILNAVGAVNATITIEPTTIEASTERVKVTVAVPLDDNSWTLPSFAPGKVLSATVELVREEDDTAYVAN